MELQDCLERDAQCLKLPPHYYFRHESAEFLYQQAHTVNLREGEGIKSHTVTVIKGSQGTDRCSSVVGRPRNDHQPLALHLSRQAAVAYRA